MKLMLVIYLVKFQVVKSKNRIARAIYFNKPIMILDECTNSLDKNSEDEILSNLFKEKNNHIYFTQ